MRPRSDTSALMDAGLFSAPLPAGKLGQGILTEAQQVTRSAANDVCGVCVLLCESVELEVGYDVWVVYVE